MLLKHLPLFFFLNVPLPCFVQSAFLFLLCMLLYHSNPLCSPLPARLSLLAPSCSPSGLSLSSLFPSVVYVAVSQQPSLLASPCSPLPARPSLLASQFVPIPPVVYVAVSQQPSLLAPPCSPLPARPQACPLVLSFLQSCMLLYHSNPLVARVMASAFSRCLSSTKKNFVV